MAILEIQVCAILRGEKDGWRYGISKLYVERGLFVISRFAEKL